jgi:predicted transcriptional regulator
MSDAEQPSVGTEQSAPAPAAADDTKRVAFILDLLHTANGQRLTRGDLNPKLKSKRGAEAGLNPELATPVLQACADKGYLQATKAGRSVAYSLTEAGAAHLETIRPSLASLKPSRSAGRIVPPASEEVRKRRVHFLLLQVLEAPGHSTTDTEANGRHKSFGTQSLGLNAATSGQLRRELAAQGLLDMTGTGRSTLFSLTRAGQLRLGNGEFLPDRDLTLSGKTLNDLLEAAREVGKQFTSDTRESHAPVDLEKALQDAYSELRRERYATSGLVPIHELRAEIRKRFGEVSARHDVFDAAVNSLRLNRGMRIIPIADHAKATPQQIQDSIQGVGEVLFYLEAAHESAVL